MHSPRPFHNVALIGFMGSGKSTVGRLVAARLRYRFVDTDALIEARAGRPISKIFAEAGEAFFRELEKQVVAELTSYRRAVMATGGGLAANPEHLASLKEHALVVCLWASPETIWERVRRQSHRPLLQTPDPQARIRELLEARQPYYRQADILINTGLRSVQTVARQVVKELQFVRRSLAER
jgi:shikimate kinase